MFCCGGIGIWLLGLKPPWFMFIGGACCGAVEGLNSYDALGILKAGLNSATAAFRLAVILATTGLPLKHAKAIQY